MSVYTIVLQSIASLTGVATSTSMIIAYRQLRLATRNSQITFEDALAREYRAVVNRLPVKALLGDRLAPEELAASLPHFYSYFDLSNEQIFLRRHGRVADLTWWNWAEGIRATMIRPAFADAWAHIASCPSSAFADLRRFLEEEKHADPIAWASSRAPARRALIPVSILRPTRPRARFTVAAAVPSHRP